MGKDKKRKRDSNVEDEAGQPPAKSQALEDGSGIAKPKAAKKNDSGRRQIRSERKKKRDIQAKQSVLRKRAEQAAIVEAAGGFDTAAKSTTQDDIATGQDFVSLPVETKRVLKEKRKSPRSIRKAARALAQENAKKNEPDAAAENRFICFVGNLPFTATTEQVLAHFSKLQPKEFRMNTDKKTGKSKGFGFVEFDNYDRMKTCLKLYHHSIFDPEGQDKTGMNENDEASAPQGRKINVELTAGGGGGKSDSRKEKIKTKNKKLYQERARDRKKKLQEEAKKHREKKSSISGQPTSGANIEQINAPDNGPQNGIHPSRRSRVTM